MERKTGLSEFFAPAADRLVAHDDATFKQQFLDVAQAQAEPEIPANRATDDDGGKTVAVIERFRLFHRDILHNPTDNLTLPHSWLSNDSFTLPEHNHQRVSDVRTGSLGHASSASRRLLLVSSIDS